MKVLVLNCGSSSIKYRLFEMPKAVILAKGLIEKIGEENSEAFQKSEKYELDFIEKIADHKEGLRILEKMLTHPAKGPLTSLSEIGACGHRVVHGGEAFTGSMKVNGDLEEAIEKYSDLAPLHNPPNLAGIREAKEILGNVPQVVCFDTAFHQTIPEVAYLYTLPFEMYEKLRIRRYGFHGISHRYVARRAAALLNKGKYDVNLITCHLGNGSSITAVMNGKSVDTSMGFTPLEGVVMGTRTGDLDPAIIFHLMRKGYSAEELEDIFNKKSGLLGISGTSNDVRTLEEKAEKGDKKALLALEVFAYRIKKYIGAYLAVLNRCDGIVFTGGIGENGAHLREQILQNMDELGIKINTKKNRTLCGKEGTIESEDSKIKIFVIPTDEEGAIAHDTYLIANGERKQI